MKVSLCRPYVGEEEVAAIREVLESGWLAHGPKAKEFELLFAEYIGTKYAASLNSCASALHASLLAHGLKGEVIVPSLTFPASANAVVNAGCTPVFAEVDRDSYTLDPVDMEGRITERTVAVMPVHYAGQSCDMEKVGALAKKHGLVVIEDSAEAIGSVFDGKMTGSFGTGCFSFYPVKNLTTAEGGMVTTNDEEVWKKVKAIAGHGIMSSTIDRLKKERPWLRDAVLPGFNYRMNDMQAAMGMVQLKKLDDMNKMRQENAAYLNEQLGSVEGIAAPTVAERRNHVYQMYVARLDSSIDRTKFIMQLRKNGVEAGVNFDPPAHLNAYYRGRYGYKKGDLPVVEDVCERIVTLPMYPGLSREQMDHVVSVIKGAVRV